MKRVLIVSKVFFDNQAEEESNLGEIVKNKIYLEGKGYEVVDLRSLLKESNDRMSSHIEGALMTVSPSAWRSFLCLSFVQGCLANSNLLYVCDNSETCPIALIIVGMARVMGVGLLYHNEAKELTEESVPEIILPYINYQPAEVDSESEPVEAEYCEPIIETPIRRKPQSAADRQLQDWFDRDCHLDLTKEN